MARIRTIKPEFWGDEKMAKLAPVTRLVFLGLISMADDRGRLVDSVKRIDAFLFPFDEDSTNVRRSLDELHANGRIKRGLTASGQKIIEMVNWHHQKIDRPHYAGCLPDITQEVSYDSTNVRRTLDEGSTNDRRTFDDGSVSVSVPTISTKDQQIPVRRAKARTTRGAGETGEGGKFPGFLAATCNAGYEAWLAKSGAVDYPRFRKAFGPAFRVAETDRPAALPRDAELVPSIGLYFAAIRGTSGARHASPEACAKAISQLAQATRETDGERRLALARYALGLTEEARRMERAAA